MTYFYLIGFLIYILYCNKDLHINKDRLGGVASKFIFLCTNIVMNNHLFFLLKICNLSFLPYL
jgi:hypothetical protein